jgi:hypothetical protein
MIQRWFRSVSRVMLTVMLITFLSPTMGWQLGATHDELEHASAHAASSGVRNDAGAAEHEHDEAHGFIGHLLGHLPACLSAPPTLPKADLASAIFIDAACEVARVALEPPFRPPRLSFLA